MPSWAQASNLRLTFWGGQARADRTYAVTDLYKAAKGTDVEGEFLAWNDYWPKLATQTAGGNAPDVIQMDYRYIVEYAKRNAIAPLDEFVGCDARPLRFRRRPARRRQGRRQALWHFAGRQFGRHAGQHRRLRGSRHRRARPMPGPMTT